MTLVWLIRTFAFLAHSDWFRKEQVIQNWPMRLNSDTLVGTIRDVKLSVSEGIPGGEGLLNNEANLKDSRDERWREKAGLVLKILSCWIQPCLIHTRIFFFFLI